MKEEKFMELALKLAEKGNGKVSPNPLVGAVIVKKGKLVGKGFHEKFGGKHAEINALRQAGEKARGAELFVNLEPCCHWGKTGPCTEEIIRAGIKKVFAAVKDPNPLVKGNGIKKLKKAGIKVELGLMKEKAGKLNEAYFKWISSKKPFVVLKIAASLNGKISGGKRKCITCKESRKKVHELRSELDAVLTGIGTVLKDNPKLNVRLCKGRNPARIVLDSRLRIPLNARVLKGKEKTIIFCVSGASEKKKKKLEKLDAEVVEVKEKKGKTDLREALTELGKRNIASVLVEGGQELNTCLLEEGLADKLLYFVAPKIIERGLDAAKGVKPEEFWKKICLKEFNVQTIGRDLLIEGCLK